MNLNEVIDWMISEGYMVSMKTGLKTTGKLNREYIPSGTVAIVKKEFAVANVEAVLTPREIYMQYIKAADVPSRCPTAKYWLNRYSNDGAKEFHRILTKENINLQVLVASTKLYYIQTKEYAKTISNYIVEGIWRTGYESMIESMQRGTIQEDIKKEIEGNKSSNMRLR